MGTTMQDFLHPEAVLLVSDENAAKRVEQFYASVVAAPVYRTSIENAGGIKVQYLHQHENRVCQHLDGYLSPDSWHGR